MWADVQSKQLNVSVHIHVRHPNACNMKSEYLDEIFQKQNRVTNSAVVFVDVSSYSKRRTKTQTEVIDAFMACLQNALMEVGKKYLAFAQANNLNFSTDIIKIPTGDGAAIVFPFEGVHDIHLSFAKALLQTVHNHNSKLKCERFSEDGWCNCHSNFLLTIGISEGKTVLFRDLNENYNAAGNCINMAARVLDLADPGQILFTSEAYQHLIDMVDDPYLVDSFREYKNLRIKHNLRVSVYQYVDTKADFINNKPPEDAEFRQRFDELRQSMAGSGFGFPLGGEAQDIDKSEMIRSMEKMGEAMKIVMSAGMKPQPKIVPRINSPVEPPPKGSDSSK